MVETGNEVQLKLQLDEMRQQQEWAQEQQDCTQKQLNDFVTRMSIIPSLATGTVAAVPFTTQVVSSSSLPLATICPTKPATPATQVAEQFWALPKQKVAKSRVKEITLGNGVTIMFTVDDIPDLKAISFACQLSRLNCIWDDTSEYWNRDSPLRIKEQPIAMIYWPAVFNYTKPKVWSEIKQDYPDWKVSNDYHDKGLLLKQHCSHRDSLNVFTGEPLRNFGLSSVIQPENTWHTQPLWMPFVRSAR